MRILVAEDDPDVVAMVRTALGRRGYAVDVAENGPDALWMASELSYDAVVLDVNLPEADGFEVCARLRAASNWTPVIFLTGRSEVTDRVRGLDAGADDYLVKPFSIQELDARLRALTRRPLTERPAVARADDIELDPATRRVSRGGVDVALTPREFSLLELLIRRVGDVVPRQEIFERLYDFAFDPRSNVLDSLVRRVRDKVDRPFGRSSIETVRGCGYRLRPGR